MADNWMTNDRKFRDESADGYPFRENPSNFAKVAAAQYGAHITLGKDGQITIAPTAYADDVVAFVLGCIAQHPKMAIETKLHLAKFLDSMDIRALSIHGYEQFPVERDYTRVGCEARVLVKHGAK
jgi:hypothetical protein